MVIREKACDGGRTLTDTRCGVDFEECLECGRAVRWDLADNPFWGFQHCVNKTPTDEHTDNRRRADEL